MGSTQLADRELGRMVTDSSIREGTALKPLPVKAGNVPSAQVLRPLFSTIDSLPSALQRIARYIAENLEATVHQSIADVSASSKSSQASVVRFCRTMGFEGFTKFKLALAAELARRPAPIERSLDPRYAVIDQLRRYTTTSIQETCECFNAESLGIVLERIASSRRVEIVGTGSSCFVAEYLAWCLLKHRVPAQGFRDIKLAQAAINGLKADAVVIAISWTGASPDLVSFLRSARGAGAFTVAITDDDKSPIARCVDQVLLANPIKSAIVDGEVTMATRMFLIEGLASLVAVQTVA